MVSLRLVREHLARRAKKEIKSLVFEEKDAKSRAMVTKAIYMRKLNVELHITVGSCLATEHALDVVQQALLCLWYYNCNWQVFTQPLECNLVSILKFFL